MTIGIDLSFFFDFRPNEVDPEITWNDEQRELFAREFQTQIPNAWNVANHVVVEGQSVSVRFATRIVPDENDAQWRIRVYKLKSSASSRQSSVGRGGASDGDLDSNDGRRKRLGNESTQTGIIHEFGHMIGLADEYGDDTSHVGDRPSIMNWGSTVRERHLAHLVDWARPHIEPEGISAVSFKRVGAPHFLAMVNEVQEIGAIRAWKRSLSRGDVVIWEFRRRDDHSPVPVDEVDPKAFDEIEVVFERIGEITEPIVWQPQSAQAVEALIEGS